MPAIASVAALLLIVFAAYFATLQNVWIDESTQLLGSGLPLGRMIRWLTGGFEPFGVPADRMPPGSYLLDWGCRRLGCARPLDYRILHLAVAATGVALVTWLAGRRHGAAAAIVTGLLLVLLPQTVMVAVEIRAYPLFFTLTAIQLVLLYRMFDRVELDLRLLGLFALVGLASVYTHFFGLVASSALFCGLVAARARSRRSLLPILAAWGALLLLAAGLVPFIAGARTVSQPAESAAVDPQSIGLYLARILGSAPMLLVPAAAVIFFVALAALLGGLAFLVGRRALRTPPAQPLGPEAALIVAVAAGVAVSILAAFAVHGFNPMKPSYSIWLLPPVALLAGSAAAQGRAAMAAAAAMLVALLPVQADFLRHADLFVHGPERAIERALGDDPRGTAIVYVGDGWPYAYYPLVFRHRDRLAHYRLDDDGTLRPLGFGGDTNLLPVDGASLDAYRRLLVVAVTPQTGKDLRAMLAAGPPPGLATAPAIAALPIDRAHWRPTAEIVRPGIYWLRLTRLEAK